MTTAPGEILTWDSAFFGRRIGRVVARTLTVREATEALAWARANDVACLYYLADAADTSSVRTAEDHRFRLVDVRMTFRWRGKGLVAEESVPVRHHRTEDVEALRAIAARSHRDGRFHQDPCFPTDRCDELYATWIANSCQGYADAVLVAEGDAGAVGYISCHLREGHGQIGLVGVAEAARGRGVGPALVGTALRWFAARGVDDVLVVTQGRNTAAQRLYQRCGFVTHAVEMYYHRWMEAEP